MGLWFLKKIIGFAYFIKKIEVDIKMIFINEIMFEYLKHDDYLIVFKDSRRHLTGNREQIMILRNGKHIKLGKCIVTPIVEYINDGNDRNLKDTLSKYVDYSGFKNVDEWFNFVKNEMNRDSNQGGFLYQINKVFMYDDDN
jgi:hypothetical protein